MVTRCIQLAALLLQVCKATITHPLQGRALSLRQPMRCRPLGSTPTEQAHMYVCAHHIEMAADKNRTPTPP